MWIKWLLYRPLRIPIANLYSQLAGRENTEYKLYPFLNHCFVTALNDDITKASKEYSLERHIGEDVIKDIADFIKGGIDHAS